MLRYMTFFLPLTALALTAILLGCAPITRSITQEDIQQLEEVKSVFESQLENDMHPAIWVYLDEVLHDPDSFRLQRFEYKISNFTYVEKYEKKTYLFGDQTETAYKNVIAPAYRILMRYRVRIPAGGVMLKEMNFFLLKDQRLVLPNGNIVPLI